MWLLKGISVGTILFLLLTVLYLVLRMTTSQASAIGTTALYAWTLQNPLYWLAFALTLLAACFSFARARL